MITQEQIAKATEEAFEEAYPNLEKGKLNKVMEGWLGDLSISNHAILPGHKLIVIAEEIEQSNPAYRYYAMRFFPGGKEGWHCSVDVDRKSFKDVTDYLLKNQK